MTRLERTHIPADQLRPNSSDKLSRTIKAADRNSFEASLEQAKNASAKKAAQTDSQLRSESVFSSLLSGEEWFRDRSKTSASADSTVALTAAVRDYSTDELAHQNDYATHSHSVTHQQNEQPEQLDIDALTDWLGGLDDQASENDWTFEFVSEQNDSLELKVSRNLDGHWSARLNAVASAEDQASLLAALSQFGVSLNWGSEV